ncbi:tryptophan-rich sensory protein [Putridiphycobacter roseus]|uniref:Tryptophan-rich sensory protein n=1 Tax=Putridiphycobacter roseus TaxID=2219161 RepID=A0A2W1N2I5_9FLAO|nr:TspO/MBR family protein [Putridiphycobacter roseus]PZE18054.1 tryptophan-rich sensory protein [Putridiphycobacter roseus]
MVLAVLIFLIINFVALGIGGIFTSKGVRSAWYVNAKQAPWTPPGWVFGVAWTLIMVCFAFYMAYLWTSMTSKGLIIGLFTVQILLNVIWNPIFFKFHKVLLGLLVIASLTLLIGFMLVYFMDILNWRTALIWPYFIWLLIATSLNAYIYAKN